MAPSDQVIQALLDRTEIQDALSRYAAGVDRKDWHLVRSAYHAGAHDDHGEYRGDVDGLIEWLTHRFADVDRPIHLVGSPLIHFQSPDHAVVESCFMTSRRVDDSVVRQSLGKYIDSFERRDGQWRIARRTVRVDSAYGVQVHALQDSSGSTRS